MIIAPNIAGGLLPVTVRSSGYGTTLPEFVAGDLIVVITLGGGYTPGPLPGYTTFQSGGGGNGYRYVVQWKIATAGEALPSYNLGDSRLIMVFANGKSIGGYSSILTVYDTASFYVPGFSLHNTDGSSQVIAVTAGQVNPINATTWTSLLYTGAFNTGYAKNTATSYISSAAVSGYYSNASSFEVKNTA